MKVLERYLRRSILSAILLTLSVLISLSGVIKFIEQLKKSGEGQYDAWVGGWYTLLSIPDDLQLFFPMAILPGVLLGLGALASRSELVVMEALGYSRLRIATAVIKTVIPLIVLSLVLHEWVVPISSNMAAQLRAQALYGRPLLSTQSGLWVKDHQDIIYIEQLQAQYDLHGVHIYHIDDNYRLTAVTHAQRATFNNGRWQLHQVDKMILQANKPLKLEQFLTSEWSLMLTPEKLGLSSMTPQAMSIARLYHYIHYLQDIKQESGRYQLALWRNLLLPLSTVSMVLLALSSIFGPLRLSTVGARVVTGISFGFIFHVLNEVVGQLSIVYKIPAYVGALFPSVLCLTLAMCLLAKSQ